MIDNGGGPAAGRCHGAGVKVVHRPVRACLEVHVGVYIHSAGEDILSGGIQNHRPRGVQLGADGLDHPILDEEIAVDYVALTDDLTVANQSIHR